MATDKNVKVEAAIAAHADEQAVDLKAAFTGEANTQLVDDETDILSNEFAGEPEGKPLITPAETNDDKFARMMEAMLRIAANTEKREQRAEAIRQKGYNEITPDSPWNPEGKRDRAKLSRPTSLQGITVNPMTHYEEEIRLFNKLKPGRYVDRKIEVRMTQDGAIDLSWPGAKNDARIDMYSRFPTLVSLLTAVVAEREAKEERRRKGVFSDEDSLE